MLSKNTLTIIIALILTTSCVTRKTTTPIIVSPEYSQTERTRTVNPSGAFVKEEVKVKVTR